MKELVTKLRFTAPCLGKIKINRLAHGKPQHFYLLPRNPVTKKVMFHRQWWLAILKKAADILCRHQSEVHNIRFVLDVEGEPSPIPQRFYKLHINSKRYSKHEAFFPGSEIAVTCIIPDAIPEEDFLKLMQYAGRYYGISPAFPGDYGFFEVVSITPTTGERSEYAEKESSSN